MVCSGGELIKIVLYCIMICPSYCLNIPIMMFLFWFSRLPQQWRRNPTRLCGNLLRRMCSLQNTSPKSIERVRGLWKEIYHRIDQSYNTKDMGVQLTVGLSQRQIV